MLTCPSCGQENPAGFRLCGMCGAPLREAPPPREERKVVTVLFCDLVGSTAQAERMDPEDVRALLSRYHERVRTDLERFGGTVEKFIGDAVMALFGAPTAHENDRERAVRAALAIREWAQEEGELQVRARSVSSRSVAATPQPGRAVAVSSGRSRSLRRRPRHRPDPQASRSAPRPRLRRAPARPQHRPQPPRRRRPRVAPSARAALRRARGRRRAGPRALVGSRACMQHGLCPSPESRSGWFSRWHLRSPPPDWA